MHPEYTAHGGKYNTETAPDAVSFNLSFPLIEISDSMAVGISRIREVKVIGDGVRTSVDILGYVFVSPSHDLAFLRRLGLASLTATLEASKAGAVK